eukprot:gene14678-14802_t
MFSSLNAHLAKIFKTRNVLGFCKKIPPFAGGITFISLLTGSIWGLLYAPSDYQQGEIFRIMYVHVPASWWALGIYLLAAGFSILGLISRIPIFFFIAKAFAPIGAGFTLISLITGSIWGKPTWGTWENVVFFITPSEWREKKAFFAKAKSLRLGGRVAKDSIVKENNRVTFDITDEKTFLRVVYKGTIPDLFKEDQGIVAEGNFDDHGIFIARQVLAKHDENYMPKEVADKLKEQAFVSAFLGTVMNTKWWPFITFSFVGLAFSLLLWAHISSDFSYLNVVQNSHTLKPLLYKISGVWANHEGSMLLWGEDLNPLLQDPSLVIHPPILYLGQVGFSVPFALCLVALLKKDLSVSTIQWVRFFTLIAWSFLTAGLALGSFWAYYELGWGGWWFWDPKQQTLKRTGLFLGLLTFGFCLFGLFFVRSGFLTSIHSFAVDPERATLFLTILYPLILGWFGQSLTIGMPYFKATFIPMMLPLVVLMGLGHFIGYLSLVAFTECYIFGVIDVRSVCIGHFGVGLMILGMVWASQGDIEKEVLLKVNQSTEIAGYTVTLNSVVEKDGPNYKANRAIISVSKGTNPVKLLEPEKRYYWTQKELSLQTKFSTL